MQVSQAEFSRQMGVSRKTVTQWKNDGRIAITEGKVDVERSHELLRHYSRGRSKGYLSAMQGGNVTGQVSTSAPAGNKPPAVAYPDVPRHVVSLVTWADCGADDVAIVLLPLLPESQVRRIHAELRGQWIKAGADLADMGYGLPPGFVSWADHPLFNEPSATLDWGDLREAAGLRREMGTTR